MDAIDQAIVRLLERHGWLSQEQLARRVRLSRPAVHQRVKRLQAAGVLKGYRAVLDWAAVGLPLTAFVWVRTGGADCSGVGPALLALQELIDRVRSVAGVQATMTTVALSSLQATEEPT